MPFSEPPAEGTTYGFERSINFTDYEGKEVAYGAGEEMCDRQCPNRTAQCGLVGMVLRAEEQYAETAEIFGIVAGEKDGEKIRGEVWLETMMNPLTDEPHIMFAPDGVEPTPDNIFKLLADGPEATVALHAADFIYPGNCLLDSAKSGSTTAR